MASPVTKDVSVLTITQGSRVDFLRIQVLNLNNQTYSHILEWVIVDGSSTDQDSEVLKGELYKLKVLSRIPMRYVHAPRKSKIGCLRNIGNAACLGAVIACMDDDDYYPPTYINHALARLCSPYQVVGCANTFVYDLRWRLLVQAMPNVKNHSANNCLVYSKSYAQSHNYDECVDYDEESSFLGIPENSLEASVPIAQMDPKHATVHMIHNTNTAEKTKAILSAVYDVPYCCVKTTVQLSELVPNDIINAYHDVIGARKKCPYDVVYCCGLWSIDWDPIDEKLGGSEQAVVQLSSAWAKMGLKVAVYGMVPNKTVHGVDYFSFNKFNPWQQFKTLILWRYHGTLPIAYCCPDIDAQALFVDFHDNIPDHYALVSGLKAARLFFKSQYHYSQYLEHEKPKSNAIIMNGLQMDHFKSPRIAPGSGRNPFRVCYTSCYTRGLAFLLQHFWPLVLALEPRAELHLYYGMEHVDANVARQILDVISRSRGVCDHGRQSIHMIAREKHMSTFHLYMTETTSEIDCIAIRESLVACCIPLLLKTGVFAERDGIHVAIGTSFSDSAKMLVRLMNNENECKVLRKRLAVSPTICSWQMVAKQWKAYMGV
jgi:glycosyltransferase involved in cell wall biosynthesis